MSYTLYYSPGACPLADHITLIDAEVPYKLVKVDLATKKTEDGRDFYTISHTGAVPVLEFPDGTLLSENIAILHYIGTIGKNPALKFKQGSIEEARLLEALAFCSDLHSAIGKTLYYGADDSGPKRRLKELEKWLEKNNTKYWLGDKPTQPDFYASVVTSWLKKSWDLSVYPRVNELVNNVFSLPCAKQALKEEGL